MAEHMFAQQREEEPRHEATMQLHEARRKSEVAASESAMGTISGTGVVVLAILGLVGVLPSVLAAVATIGLGAALFFEGSSVAVKYSSFLANLQEGRAEQIEVGGGMSAEFLGGIAGIALGILALLTLSPLVLMPVAVITIGAALLLSAGTTARVGRAMAMEAGISPSAEHFARQMAEAASGGQILIGLAGVALGILALVAAPSAALTLTLVGLLALGASTLLSGSAFTGRAIKAVRREGR